MHGTALSLNMTTADTHPDPATPLRMLVAIASYGSGNDAYLRELISTYQSMSLKIDIIVLSNIAKDLSEGVECRVGLPNRNPWSLPFGHKKLFAEQADNYDLFLYSEDDILVTERNIRAFLAVSEELAADEVAGFLRFEEGTDGRLNYPDWHAHFHWDCASVRSRGEYVVAHFSNEHSACYLLTQSQLKAAIRSGGFLVDPHEEKYDLLCAAATDPYTQCGMTKLIPVSHIDDFTVHHMSNKYVDVVGISSSEFRRQVDALLAINEDHSRAGSLIDTETTLPRGAYSKDYYAPRSVDVLSAVPLSAKRVLSIGYGAGMNELALTERGVEVTVVPLNAVCAASASANGLRVVEGDLDTARTKLGSETFDCVLYLDVLHLADDPGRILSLFRPVCAPGGTIVIQSPNLRSAQAMRWSIRSRRLSCSNKLSRARAYQSSVRVVGGWCRTAGYTVIDTTGMNSRPIFGYRGSAGSFIDLFMAAEFLVTARPATIYGDLKA